MPNKPAQVFMEFEVGVKLTKMISGSWTKYGGARHGVLKKKKIDAWGERRWNCQACGEELPSEIPAYMLEFAPLEYVRICPPCNAEALRRRIETLHELIRYVRRA